MSSNRLSYDACAYQDSLQQSTDPLNYMLYTGKYENSAKCRIEFGVVGGNGVSLFTGNLVDLESDLRGQTRLASQCPRKLYHPTEKSTHPHLANQPSCQMQYYPTVPVSEQEVHKGCSKEYSCSNNGRGHQGEYYGYNGEYNHNKMKHPPHESYENKINHPHHGKRSLHESYENKKKHHHRKHGLHESYENEYENENYENETSENENYETENYENETYENEPYENEPYENEYYGEDKPRKPGSYGRGIFASKSGSHGL